MHLNLATRDLDRAVAFYATLLGRQPVKKLADYAADPEGRRWETYVVHEETVERDDAATSCCATGGC